MNKFLKSLFTVVFSYAAYGVGVTLLETVSGSYEVFLVILEHIQVTHEKYT
jgi:hypothetical protein